MQGNFIIQAIMSVRYIYRAFPWNVCLEHMQQETRMILIHDMI